MDASEWIPLLEADDLIEDELGSPLLAWELIFEVLAAGKLRSVAAYFIEKGDGLETTRKQSEPVPAEFWHGAELAHLQNGATKHVWLGRNKSGKDMWRHYEAHAVRVSLEDLTVLWPGLTVQARALELPISRPAQCRTGVGGRPLAHDWARAGAFLAAFEVQNGFSEQPNALVKALKDWFAENFKKQPDDKDVRLFANRYFEERAKI